MKGEQRHISQHLMKPEERFVFDEKRKYSE